MRRLSLVSSRFVLGTLFVALLVGSARGEGTVARVLLYHRIGDARYPSTNVSVEAFRAQLDWLADKGFSVVPTGDLEDAILRNRPLPPNAVVIHFDDGYRSVFENAFPVLKSRGLPFTIFLPCEAIERGYPDFVTWEMVVTMSRHGGSFGAHGVGHLRLEAGMGATAQRGLAEEFGGAASWLRERGLAARWLAYPFGEYTTAVLQEAERAGFALAFSQDPGSIGPRSDRFRLPRFAVVGAVGNMDTFQERMGYAPLTLEEETPPLGFLESPTPVIFRARVNDPHRFEPNSVAVFVSELGQIPARFDPATGVVAATGGRVLRRRMNRVLVSLREKSDGTFAVGSWLLLNPSPPAP